MRGGKAHALFSRVAEAGAPAAIVMPADAARGLQVQLRQRDVAWGAFLQHDAAAAAITQPHVAAASDTCCVLFSSGTTGKPIPCSQDPHRQIFKCAAAATGGLPCRMTMRRARCSKGTVQ